MRVTVFGVKADRRRRQSTGARPEPLECLNLLTLAWWDVAGGAPDMSTERHAVHEAAKAGDAEAVRRLVQAHPDLVHIADATGWTSLLYAAVWDRVDVMRYLLDSGADINHRDLASCSTALHWACYKGNVEVMALLLSRGADGRVKEHQGRTPLIDAAAQGQPGAVDLLLRYGACDVDAMDNNDRTAIFWCCVERRQGILRMLLEAGADPFMSGGYTVTPLHVAVALRRRGCIQILEGWHSAYTLIKARRVIDAVRYLAHSPDRDIAGDHMAPFLKGRTIHADALPTLEPPVAHTGLAENSKRTEEGRDHRMAARVVRYAMTDLTAELFVDLVQIMDILPQT